MLEHWNKLHAGQDRMRTAGEHRREKHSGSMIPDDFCFGSQTGGCASVTQCAGTNEGRRRAMVVKQLTALAMIAVVTTFVGPQFARLENIRGQSAGWLLAGAY